MPGYAHELTYHPNGALAQVSHANGLRDSLGRDPHWMTRPLNLRTGPSAGGAALWASGAYTYDPAGNVATVGTDRRFYDEMRVWLRPGPLNGVPPPNANGLTASGP